MASNGESFTKSEMVELERLNQRLFLRFKKFKDRRWRVYKYAKQYLESKGDSWADVKAFAIANDLLGEDIKYRVMVAWANRWVTKIQTERKFGNFSNLTLIGHGGFGAVFKAWDGKRHVAVKVARFNEIADDRFTVPSDATRNLSIFWEVQRHLSIKAAGCVPILDGTTGIPKNPAMNSVLKHLRNSPLWFSTMLIDGKGSLRDVIDKRDFVPGQSLTIDQIENYMKKCASTLQRLHTQRDKSAKTRKRSFLVHKDFKPDNVVIDENDEPWIVDFGLTAPRVESHNSELVVSGTLHYMAPEQVDPQGVVNNQTDIWAWGVTFFELLTGTTPFDVDSPDHLKKMLDQPYFDPPSSLVNFEIPDRIEKVIAGCLRKDRQGPNSRYANFGKVLKELRSSKPEKIPISIKSGGYACLILFLLGITWWLIPPSDSFELLANQLQNGTNRLEPDILSKTEDMLANGNAEQKVLAENAIRRHRWSLEIDYILAKGFGFIDISKKKAIFEGNEVEILQDIKSSIEKKRQAIFDRSLDLPKDFRSATNRLINDLEKLIEVSLANIDRSGVDSRTKWRQLSYLMSNWLNGTNLSQIDAEGIDAGHLESCFESAAKWQEIAIEYGARTDWGPLSLVSKVQDKSAASERGIRVGDVLLEIDSIKVRSQDPRDMIESLNGKEYSAKFLTIDGPVTFRITKDQTLGTEFDTSKCEVPILLIVKDPLLWGTIYGRNAAMLNYGVAVPIIENVTIKYEDPSIEEPEEVKITEIRTNGIEEPKFSGNLTNKSVLTISASGYSPRKIDLSKYWSD